MVSDYLRLLTLRTLGNFLILLALFLIVRTFSDPVMAELNYLYNSIQGTRYTLAEDYQKDYGSDRTKGGFGSVNGGSVRIIKPVDPEFGIVIPKIDANATIIKNVDVINKSEYLKALQKGVAQAKGTAFPGEGGHIFLFAHSTDNFWNVGTYNAIFYLLYKLDRGDEIDLFYKGIRHKYLVDDTKIVSPRDVQYLTKKTTDEFLTLQTCWPPGTTLQRLLVFAKPVVAK